MSFTEIYERILSDLERAKDVIDNYCEHGKKFTKEIKRAFSIIRFLGPIQGQYADSDVMLCEFLPEYFGIVPNKYFPYKLDAVSSAYNDYISNMIRIEDASFYNRPIYEFESMSEYFKLNNTRRLYGEDIDFIGSVIHMDSYVRFVYRQYYVDDEYNIDLFIKRFKAMSEKYNVNIDKSTVYNQLLFKGDCCIIDLVYMR